MAALPGVTGVRLNFAAAKITVEGTVDPAAIQARAQQHHLQVRLEREEAPALPWWKTNPHLVPTLVAAVFALAGEAVSLLGGGEGLAARALYAVAILAGGLSTARKGLRNLLRLQFDMNGLMAIAVAGAAAIGQWSEGATVAVLFGVSEMLEAYTIDRARRSLTSLMEIAPKTARIRRDGAEIDLPVDEVAVGDLLIVRPGEKLAMDGVVIAGQSAVNQATITGESVPVEKAPGSEVFAGTINGHGALEVRVTRRSEDSTFARVVRLVEEAQAQRAPTQTFIERFARYYTPAVTGLAGLIAILPPLLLGEPWQPWLYRGLALLVVACPCALVVSTPVSILAAISNAARSGVLIKGGAHLERAGTLKAIAFDKTGTLTRGRPALTDAEATGGGLTTGEMLCLAAAVEERSEHPLARAVVEARTCGHARHDAQDFQAIVGRGAKAVVGGQEVFVGSPALFRDDLGLALGAAGEHADRWQTEGKTVMLVGTQGGVVGAIAVADTPRAGTADALAGLKAAGVTQTVMLTGDNAVTARAIGRAVGVDEVRAGLLPEAKVEAVRALAREHGAVAMVGDGVNDAPALAAATVGIAMGGAGTDVALQTADIALMADDLSKLPFTIRLSKKTLAAIRQNIAIALGLKLLAVLAVFPGWLTLWLAIMADMGATVLVTLNGMRLLRVKA